MKDKRTVGQLLEEYGLNEMVNDNTHLSEIFGKYGFDTLNDYDDELDSSELKKREKEIDNANKKAWSKLFSDLKKYFGKDFKGTKRMPYYENWKVILANGVEVEFSIDEIVDNEVSKNKKKQHNIHTFGDLKKLIAES